MIFCSALPILFESLIVKMWNGRRWGRVLIDYILNARAVRVLTNNINSELSQHSKLYVPEREKERISFH